MITETFSSNHLEIQVEGESVYCDIDVSEISIDFASDRMRLENYSEPIQPLTTTITNAEAKLLILQ